MVKEAEGGITDIGGLKARVIEQVESHRARLISLSRKIHAHPELGFQESRAAEWLAGFLEEQGFAVERGTGGMPTAFRARYGRGRPAVAFLAEYDALPGLGHACGHNLIALSSVGAGLAARPAIDRCGGSALVIGTPAEEVQGGKIALAGRGAFAGLDAAMLVHPDVRNSATTKSLACVEMAVEFFGRASHAAARPEAGINALDAMILAFNAIGALRQQMKSSARIHGIITKGGEAPNIIPDYTAATFLVRAEDDAYLEEMKERVLACFIGAEKATGARLEYRWGEGHYAAMRNNLTLARLFRENMAALGRKIPLSNPSSGLGSTDMGNVSQVAPAIHPFISIAPAPMTTHSPDFARAAASERGMEGMIEAAKAMAMTAVDLLAGPELLRKVKKEFEAGK